MNLSNFGINAYKTTAKSESSENNSDKKVFTPIFEKISSTKKENENQGFYKSSFSSENKKTAESGQHKTMNEIFDKRFFHNIF